MQLGISTKIFLRQRLRPGLLEAMRRAGAAVIEIQAARHHFNYTDASAVREIAAWFRDSGTVATMHQPLSADDQWSRHGGPVLNLIDAEKVRRIAAMDEIKRALEAAEQIPFRSIVLHLGIEHDRWDMRSLENSLTAIEHIKAFAAPLGVKVLLENLANEVTTPEHLLEILQVGHFDDVGVCLDIGHAHLNATGNPGSGIEAAFEALKPRIAELHLHDNNGQRDEHLWPGDASAGVDWTRVHELASTLPGDTPGILEIAHELEDTPENIGRRAETFFSDEARRSEKLGQKANAEPPQQEEAGNGPHAKDRNLQRRRR